MHRMTCLPCLASLMTWPQRIHGPTLCLATDVHRHRLALVAGASSAPPAPGGAPRATTPEGWDPRCPPASAPLASAGSFSFPPVPAGAGGPAAGDGGKPDPDPDPGAGAAGAAAPPQHVQAGARAEPDAEQTLNAAPDPATPYGAATLLGCLHRFVRPEALGPGERWTCGRCQAERRAVKQMSICRLPPVLCLHVKRFEHTVQPGPKRSKLLHNENAYVVIRKRPGWAATRTTLPPASFCLGVGAR